VSIALPHGVCRRLGGWRSATATSGVAVLARAARSRRPAGRSAELRGPSAAGAALSTIVQDDNAAREPRPWHAKWRLAVSRNATATATTTTTTTAAATTTSASTLAPRLGLGLLAVADWPQPVCEQHGLSEVQQPGGQHGLASSAPGLSILLDSRGSQQPPPAQQARPAAASIEEERAGSPPPVHRQQRRQRQRRGYRSPFAPPSPAAAAAAAAGAWHMAMWHGIWQCGKGSLARPLRELSCRSINSSAGGSPRRILERGGAAGRGAFAACTQACMHVGCAHHGLRCCPGGSAWWRRSWRRRPPCPPGALPPRA
jgi:hypothetical protein